MDTVNDLFEKLNGENCEWLRTVLVKYLFTKRVFHKSRLQNNYFTKTIDGTGVLDLPYAKCPHKSIMNSKISYSQLGL
ncbi:MAG: hypothetical protein ACI86M_002578 [Saprospiraceae bacterium]|jgi:hypothetical protein